MSTTLNMLRAGFHSFDKDLDYGVILGWGWAKEEATLKEAIALVQEGSFTGIRKDFWHKVLPKAKIDDITSDFEVGFAIGVGEVLKYAITR